MTATAEGVFSPALRLVTIGLLVSVGIVAFDGLGVTTALPAIASELGGMATYGWAVSALMLASVAGTVIAGFLADRHNPRGPYLAGFGIFTAGLVMSGLATSWALQIGMAPAPSSLTATTWRSIQSEAGGRTTAGRTDGTCRSGTR